MTISLPIPLRPLWAAMMSCLQVLRGKLFVGRLNQDEGRSAGAFTSAINLWRSFPKTGNGSGIGL